MLKCCCCGYPVFRFRHSKKGMIIGSNSYNKCWICGSLARERLVYLYLNKIKNRFNVDNRKIWFVSPEKVLFKVISPDVVSEYGKTDGIDLRCIPFESNSFDLIVCNHVLEHIHRDDWALKEMYRVLKPGGMAVLQVPILRYGLQTIEESDIDGEFDKKTEFGEYEHVRVYGKDYRNRLGKSGFRVKVWNWTKYNPEWREYGLDEDERVYVVEKII